MRNVLKDIICQEFEQRIGRGGGNPRGTVKGPQRALHMLFTCYNGQFDYKVELIIYAPQNYIGVHSRTLNMDGSPKSDWVCHAYHDCEWRSGVGEFLYTFDGLIKNLDSILQPWYTIHFLDDQMIADLKASHLRSQVQVTKSK